MNMNFFVCNFKHYKILLILWKKLFIDVRDNLLKIFLDCNCYIKHNISYNIRENLFRTFFLILLSGQQ